MSAGRLWTRRGLLAAALPLAAGAQPARIENASSQHWHARVAGFAREPVVPGSIVFLGDSMTERFPLQALLGARTRRTLVNRGIGGDKVGGWRYWGLLDRLDAVLALQPAQLVLMIGINDLTHANTPFESLLPNATRLLERLSRLPAVLVQAVLPVRDSLALHRARLAPYNAHLQAEVQRLGLDWLDLRDDFTAADGLLRADWASDAVHLNAAGYAHWAMRLGGQLIDPLPAR